MELVGLKWQERGYLNLEKEKTRYRDSEEKFQKKIILITDQLGEHS